MSSIDKNPPDQINEHLRAQLKKVVLAISDGESLEKAMNIVEEESISFNNASPLLQDIFQELEESQDKTSLRTTCRSILNKISSNQGGYAFESMFTDTIVIFESKKQQNAFLSVRNNLTTIDVSKNNRLTGLLTDLTFNEECAGYLEILFPNLKKGLHQDLEEGIIQIKIESGKIAMRYKGRPSD
jgi:hypothetical protein